MDCTQLPDLLRQCMLRWLSTGFVFAAFAACLCSTNAVAQERPEWTTGKISGSPEPPPAFRPIRRFPNLKFDQPLAIERDSANSRLWVVTRNAKIFSFPDQDDVQKADLFVDLQAEFPNLIPLEGSTKAGSAFCIAFHPQYPKVPYCWITYTLKKPNWRDHLEQGSRLSRFRVLFDGGVPKCDVSSERILLSWLEGGHNGGALRFGPDGYLYVSAGDGEVPNPPDRRRAGQDVTNQLSTILRINVSTLEEGPAYTIPADNPFSDATAPTKIDATKADPSLSEKGNFFRADEAMPEIWAYGFRNPWKMNFDHKGRLWVGDVGWELYEMVHNVTKGGNYGWSLFEGSQPLLSTGRRGPTPVLPAALVYHHSEGASVTGGLVYRGDSFPELQGQYIFGDYETRRIWASRIIESDKPGNETLAGLNDLTEPILRIVAFGEDSKNELLLVHMDEGTLYGLARNVAADSNRSFPHRLSDTGLFKDLGTQTPSDGVFPFEINEALYTGDTNAKRWIALFGRTPGQVLKKGKRRDNSPLRDKIVVAEDSVAVRTVSKSDHAGRPVNLETQILHFNGKVWNPYSYVWNPEQTDASLVPASGAIIDLKSYGEFASQEPYRIHSRSECIRCHNSWVGGLLAFSLPQLNRPIALQALQERGAFGGAEFVNQLEWFEKIGLISGSIPKDPATSTEAHCRALASSTDESRSIDHRVRSFLDVNCAHCHQNGAGGTATIDLRYQAKLADAKLLDAVPMQGAFGIEDAKIIAPGRPEQSTLLYRIACDGRGHMPHIGSDTVNSHAVKLVTQWIQSLGQPSKQKIPGTLRSTSSALQLVTELDAGDHSAEAEQAFLAEARKSPAEIRNLFVRFQPEEYRRTRRILDERAILSLNGNAAAGATIFKRSSLQCQTCHQAGGQGGAVGPALDHQTVTQQSAGQLLESMLAPSRKISPGYAAWTVVLGSGKTMTGLLKERNESEVTLMTSKNEVVKIANRDIEELVQQKVSLMPDRLLESLTDQQIADLIAWLKSN